MEAAALIDALTPIGPLPREALKQASEAKDDLIPVFIERIETYLASPDPEAAGNSIFFMIHLLAQWRATAAYPTLARLLRSPRAENALGWDTVTENGPPLMASVFDGDPEPLFAIIRDAQADELTRAVMLETLAVLTARGMLDREVARVFLRACWDELEPHAENYVWVGWVDAVANLGFAEMAPLAEEAFDKGLIDPGATELRCFHKDLADALTNPDRAAWLAERRNGFFGDVVDELARWHCFSEKYLARPTRAEDRDDEPMSSAWECREPHVNPFRDVGRNDPCPCASGKKFKKCCLN